MEKEILPPKTSWRVFVAITFACKLIYLRDQLYGLLNKQRSHRWLPVRLRPRCHEWHPGYGTLESILPWSRSCVDWLHHKYISAWRFCWCSVCWSSLWTHRSQAKHHVWNDLVLVWYKYASWRFKCQCKNFHMKSLRETILTLLAIVAVDRSCFPRRRHRYL